jgi:hypothetical protein
LFHLRRTLAAVDAGDVLTLIGDVAAAAAALFALLALGKANDAIKESKAQRIAMEKATREASQAAKDAAEDHRAANAEAKAARRDAVEAAKEASADRLTAAKFAMSQQFWEQEQRLADVSSELARSWRSSFGRPTRSASWRVIPKLAAVAQQAWPVNGGVARSTSEVCRVDQSASIRASIRYCESGADRD